MVEGAKVFIRELEDSKLIKELIYYRDRVKSNKEIMDLLSIIHKEEDDNMLIYYRKKIYSYDDYREYMIRYNELSMIVGSINKMFRELMDEKVGDVMKVISGIYKGRNLKGFNIDGTRPTMDRVKESLFASISGYIDNANILDLFCGSGALGIEALSNGGKWCDFCDNNREVIKVVRNNINSLGIRNCEIYKMDYRDMLKRIKLMGSKYDIVFLDPPYNKRIINDIIYTLIMDDMVNEEGLIVIEHSGNYEYIDYDGLVVIKDKKYGDKFITILQKVIDN